MGTFRDCLGRQTDEAVRLELGDRGEGVAGLWKYSTRIRIRVFSGSRGVFACPNHDKDQPCRAVQQPVDHTVTSLSHPNVNSLGKDLL